MLSRIRIVAVVPDRCRCGRCEGLARRDTASLHSFYEDQVEGLDLLRDAGLHRVRGGRGGYGGWWACREAVASERLEHRRQKVSDVQYRCRGPGLRIPDGLQESR